LSASPRSAIFFVNGLRSINDGELVMNGHVYGKSTVTLQRSSIVHGLGSAVGAAFDLLLAWQERVRSRRMLRGLDDHMLNDIGIDRSVAEKEGTVPFWR